MTQIILGKVPSKSNSYRIINIGGHASLGKTSELTTYEQNFYLQCNRYRNLNIKGLFAITLKVFYPSNRLDLDNSLKIILDCLQKCKAIDNDNKCVRIEAEKYVDKLNPRIEFSLSEMNQ